jgi:hypothetical protein
VGDAGVTLGAPGADSAIGLVVDFYGDVAHAGSREGEFPTL